MADLDLLRSFLAIYRAGSISRAAFATRLTQPTLSQQLMTLEARVGRPLFTRRSRGVLPTPAGEDLARAAALHLDALEVLFEAACRGSEAPSGALYLGGPAEFLMARVLPALAPLVHRGVELKVSCDLAVPLLERLAGGELDLVIASKRVGTRGLHYEPLYEETFVLVGAPAWARHVSRKALEEGDTKALLELPMLAYAEDLPVIRRFFREGLGLRLTVKPRAVVPDLRALRALAEAGAGITVLPRYLCREALDSGTLVELYRPATEPRNQLFVATQTGGGRTRRILLATEALLRAAVTW